MIIAVATPVATAQEESSPSVPAAIEEPPAASIEKRSEAPAGAKYVAPPMKIGYVPKWFWLDFKHVVAQPFHGDGNDWLTFAGGVALVGVSMPADEKTSDWARKHASKLGAVGDTLEGLGDERAMVLLTAFYLEGAIFKDSKAKDVCLDGLIASAIGSGLLNAGIATVVGRDRPTDEKGAFSFHPFRGRSFPSGHTTGAFAVASVIATHYDQLWVQVLAYGGATVAGYERLRRGKHFLSDVIAGALIGTAVGRSVVHYNDKLRAGKAETEPEKRGMRLSLFPIVGDRTYGLSATLTF